MSCELRYTLQSRGARERRWITARSFDAERADYRVSASVMVLAARKWPARAWRLVLMPYNVLADSIGPLAYLTDGAGDLPLEHLRGPFLSRAGEGAR